LASESRIAIAIRQANDMDGFVSLALPSAGVLLENESSCISSTSPGLRHPDIEAFICMIGVGGAGGKG